MTLVSSTPRTQTVVHAYTVPVVRELAPKRADLAAGSTW
jgi:hypothetical protein